MPLCVFYKEKREMIKKGSADALDYRYGSNSLSPDGKMSTAYNTKAQNQQVFWPWYCAVKISLSRGGHDRPQNVYYTQ